MISSYPTSSTLHGLKSRSITTWMLNTLVISPLVLPLKPSLLFLILVLPTFGSLHPNVVFYLLLVNYTRSIILRSLQLSKKMVLNFKLPMDPVEFLVTGLKILSLLVVRKLLKEINYQFQSFNTLTKTFIYYEELKKNFMLNIKEEYFNN